MAEEEKIDAKRLNSDKLYFAKEMMDFVPRPEQRVILVDPSNRKHVRAGRRWGKDTMIMCGDIIPSIYQQSKLKVGMYGPGWEEIDAVMEIFHEWVDGTILEKSILKPYNRHTIKLTNGSSIIARVASLTSRGKRGRGFGILNWVEAAYIPEKVVASIRATRLIGAAPEWMSSTPFGRNHFYKSEMSGVYDCWHFTSYDNPLIQKKELEKEKELMTDMEFRQEIMAEYLDDHGSPFPKKLVEAYYTGYAHQLRQEPEVDAKGQVCMYYAGLDLGRRRDKSVLYILKSVGTKIYIHYVWEFNYNPDDPIFWDKVLKHTEFACNLFKVRDIWVDQTGIGDKPVADLKNSFAEHQVLTRVTGVDFSYAVKNKWQGLVNSLALRFERFQIRGPYIRELVRQLDSISFDAQVRKFVAYGKSPDHVVALSLANQAVPRYDVSSFYAKANDGPQYSPYSTMREVKQKQAILYP